MIVQIVSPRRADIRDAVFRYDVQIETLLEQCHSGEDLKFDDLDEEVGTVSWIKSCRVEVLRGIVGSGRVVVWRVYLLYCTHSIRFVEMEE